MSVLRELGPMEAEFAHQARIGHANFCTVLFLKGHWPSLSIRDTLNRLQIPLLRARLDGPLLSSDGPDEIPFTILHRQSDEDWRALAEEKIRESRDASVAHFYFLIGPDHTEIVVALSHAVFDGLSGITIGRLFLQAMTGTTVTQDLEAPMSFLLPAWDEASHGRFLKTQKRKIPTAVQRYETNELPTVVTESTALDWTESETAALITKAKRHGLRLFPLICAASMKAAAEVYRGSRGFAGLTVPVNLRPYLKSPVPDAALGVYMGFLLNWENVEAELPVLAASIQRNLDEGLKSGEAFHRQRVLREKNLDLPRASISISNIGRIDDMEAPLGMRVISCRSLVALWATDPVAIVMQSYGGRLLVALLSSREKLGSAAGPSWAEATRRILTLFS